MITNVDWMEYAQCIQSDPEIFHPVKGGPAPHAAYQICGGCDVRIQCLEYALVSPSLEGIWGGTTERQRRRLRKSKAA